MKTANVTRVQTQLCLTAAALAGTAMGFEQTASAAINTTFAGANLSVPATLAGVYINLATGATGTSAGAVAGWDFNPYLGGGNLGFYWGTGVAPEPRNGGVSTGVGTNIYADLAFGTIVGPGGPYTSAIAGTNPNYRDSGVSYLGFRFNNNGVWNYGYAAILTSATNGFPATVQGWVFEDTGAPISVQAIPAPGAASLLGLLAAGATTRRSRRAA